MRTTNSYLNSNFLAEKSVPAVPAAPPCMTGPYIQKSLERSHKHHAILTKKRRKCGVSERRSQFIAGQSVFSFFCYYFYSISAQPFLKPISAIFIQPYEIYLVSKYHAKTMRHHLLLHGCLVPVVERVVEEGSTAFLPCDVLSAGNKDDIFLILWFKDNATKPMYR